MIQKIRKYGFYTKGIVYLIIGVLTFLAAFELGGKVSGKNEVVIFIENQIFGRFLILIVSLGLFSYSCWRFYKSYKVIKEKGEKTKYFLFIDYFIRGIIYASFAISIMYKVLDWSTNDVSKKAIAKDILSVENGQIWLYIFSVVILISAINQFAIVYKNSFLKGIKNDKNIESFAFLKKSGKFGITSRGISFLIFAYFMFRAASEKNANKILGTQGMFDYLNNLTFGKFLMATMALGFVSYGIFQYFFARYSDK